MEVPNVRVIVLAAQRKGVVDPLATRFGTSHKCLVPIMGKPLIGHVLDALIGDEQVTSIAISVESDAVAAISALLPSHTAAEIVFIPAGETIADSVFAAAGGHPGTLDITSAHHGMLTPRSVMAIRAALRSNDAAFAMAPREAVLAAHPEGQRRFYRFRDREYSNCNLYGIAHRDALHAAEVFRGGGQFAKKVSRIVGAFGLANLVLLRLRALTLAGVARRLSSRIGLGIAPVVLADGTQAIDVDNDRTFAVVEQLLRKRTSGEQVKRGQNACSAK